MFYRLMTACAVGSLLLPSLAAAADWEPRPFLTKHCLPCHGPAKTKGGLRVDQLNHDLLGGPDGERWQGVLDALRQGDMPPEEARQPTAAQRAQMIDGLSRALEQAAQRRQAEASSLLRRLTREQHTNTLRDLLGVDSHYHRRLPPESPSKMGMHNDGRVLSTSTLHLDEMMNIARVAVDRALSLGSPPPAWRFRFVFGPQHAQPAKKVDLGYQSQPLAPHDYLVETFADRGPVRTPTLTPPGNLRDRCYVDLRGSTDHDHKNSAPRFEVTERGVLLMPAKPHVEREAQIWQGPNPNLGLVLRDFPSEGAFVLRVTAARASADGEAPWLRAFLGNRLDDGVEAATFDEPRRVDAPPGKPAVFEFRGRLENLPAPVVDPSDKEFLSNLMVVGVWNDVLVADPRRTSPAVVIKAIEFEGPVTEAWPSASHRRIFFDERRLTNPGPYARDILERFLTRAFRRPPTPAQLNRYVGFWQQRTAAGVRFHEAMRDTLAAALASPAFLHHVEEARGRALDEHALASRLSYFLWNSMPDEPLMALAARGQLRQQLAQQAGRMLDDPRARSFLEAFTTQWLDLAALDRVRVNVEQTPRFTRFVKDDMRTETLRFVEHLFRQNRPLTELVDADYTLMNANLAAFYGLPDVRGPAFRIVKLPVDSRRGGLLTQGSFLAGHSTGDDSHPIKRGVWVTKKLLDDPPPPPPPNVPEIDRENPAIAKLSVKEQLQLHRDRESCRACHRKLDPWGVPFESFGPAGLMRVSISKQVHGQTFTSAVDTSSELVDGTKIDGVEGLKRYLIDKRRDQLRRSVVRHLAAYALGRTPGFIDQSMLAGISERTRARGDGLREMILAVVESPAFQSK